MMTFFPSPYQDEILYSVLARYHVRSGNTSIKATLEDLYSKTTATAVMDLPSHLNRLIENMPVGSRYTVNELIRYYTLFPFYAAFLPPEQAESIKKFMEGDKGGGVYNKIGLMASSISLNQYFKFCPECIKKDAEEYGELYWHRVHQVSGIHICSKHKMLLQDSKVSIRGFNKHQYTAATLENCIMVNGKNGYSDDTMEKLFKLSSDVQTLLDNELEQKAIKWFVHQYTTKLIDMGLANMNGNIKQKELIKSFINYFGEEFLTLIGSSIDVHSDHNWLTDLVRRKNKTSHPLRHLLLLKFIGVTIEELFTNKFEYKPFGNGEWPCLNPAADHYLENTIKEIEIKYNTDSKNPLGTFRCSCGFTYLRSGPDTESDDRYKISKVKNYGTVWEEKIKELAEKKLSLRETSRRLKVDPATVKKYAKKLGVKTYWENRSNKEEEEILCKDQVNTLDNLIDVRRNEWLWLMKQNPDKGKAELRQLNKALYVYLYRKDKEWLNSNSPKKRTTANVSERVDWKKRDDEIVLNVKRVVNEIVNSQGKPQRITITLVGGRLGIKALLEKHLDKLPKTKKYIDEVTENITEFQLRRIKWAIQKIKNDGQEIKLWKIFRYAGIRKEHQALLLQQYGHRIHEYIEDLE